LKNIIPSEALLIAQLSDNDEVAFTTLYNQYFNAVNLFVLKFVKSPQLSEDITQEVFIKIWEGRDKLAEIKSFKAWLFTVARNHTLNILKKISNESAGMGEVLKNYKQQHNPVEDTIAEGEYMQQLNEILNSLPPKTREVFRLCREEQKSYDEVIQILGISRSAVKKHMVRSHKAFKENINGKLEISIGIVVIFVLTVS
jgi:RNA polymerase sigma-70 factor (ECF subfamily)